MKLVEDPLDYWWVSMLFCHFPSVTFKFEFFLYRDLNHDPHSGARFKIQ